MNQNTSDGEIIQKLQKDIQYLNLKNQTLNQKFCQLHDLLISEGFFDNIQRSKAEPFLPINKLINRDYDILVLAFCGISLGLGMPPFEFLRTFQERNISCIFFKDFHQFWY